ncbi:MAG: hypothetical protein QHJ81_16160, partial [Anaerolineae bacterium]|nr:hypothetical protein [Anaerolineae bacterium]
PFARRVGMLMLVAGALLVVSSCHSALFNAPFERPSAPPTLVERLVPTPPLRPSLPTPGAAPAETAEQASTAPASPTSLTPALSQREREDALTPALFQEERLPHPTLAQGEREALSLRERFGVGVAAELGSIEQYDVGQLGAGWYLDWCTNIHPPRPQGMEYAQMVSVFRGGFYPDLKSIAAIAAANPGSLWLIGNEPDVIWQGNVPPADYARSYHQIYFALKRADPSCQVAIGGVSQPTPLRFQYLDMILHAYRRLYGQVMPVDVWNVHAFILREEKDSWGVDIPPGIEATRGLLYEIEDHDDLEIFKQQIIAFRRWMRERGEREKPLIISEYGILMPADYGFDHARVRQFMYASFDFFLTATDDELGYPPDDNRLVQRWAWFSLSNEKYPTGNLFHPDTQRITPLGMDYAHYLSQEE